MAYDKTHYTREEQESMWTDFWKEGKKNIHKVNNVNE